MHVLPALFSLESAGCGIRLLTRNKRGKGKRARGKGQGAKGKSREELASHGRLAVRGIDSEVL